MPLRLNSWFRWTIYILIAGLFASGTIWLAADSMKDSPEGEMWQAMAADLLMIHGGIAMLTLMAFGALIPTHLIRAWRGRKNRQMGFVMGVAMAILIVTAFGLYYLGSDLIRPWLSDIHLAAGLALPVLLVLHIASGRRARTRNAERAADRLAA